MIILGQFAKSISQNEKPPNKFFLKSIATKNINKFYVL